MAMKTYSIGRDVNCDIVINDSTDVISRRHALLNVTPSGKMTIIDQSSNGTYVNGIRISQNVPVPVTRKDIISLAHVSKLDWSQIPKSNMWVKYCIGAVIALAVIAGVFFGLHSLKDKEAGNQSGPNGNTELNDSTLIKQREEARLDSIKKAAQQDSIKKAAEKARRDSLEKKNPGNKPPKPPKPQPKDDKDKDKTDTPNTPRGNRAIG